MRSWTLQWELRRGCGNGAGRGAIAGVTCSLLSIGIFSAPLASIYWLTRTIGTSLRIYWDNLNSGPTKPLHDRMPAVEVPAGFAVHPKEVMLVPRSIVAEGTTLQRWSLMPRGGHFGFAEQPAALTGELRSFFRPLRNAG
jgi:hypothetical protein